MCICKHSNLREAVSMKSEISSYILPPIWLFLVSLELTSLMMTDTIQLCIPRAWLTHYISIHHVSRYIYISESNIFLNYLRNRIRSSPAVKICILLFIISQWYTIVCHSGPLSGSSCPKQRRSWRYDGPSLQSRERNCHNAAALLLQDRLSSLGKVLHAIHNVT